MKKALTIYGLGWVALIAALIVYAVAPSHHNLAKSPKNIEKIINIDLPDFAETESDDNLDRGASRWDNYIHRVKFAEELSEECIKELEERCATDSEHWQMLAEKNCYLYSDDKQWEEGYYVGCHIYKDHCLMEYMIDEDESIFYFAFWVLGFLIVNAYGLVILIIWLIRKIRNRKKQ